jgi:hypothetical protein
MWEFLDLDSERDTNLFILKTKIVSEGGLDDFLHRDSCRRI